MGVVTVEIYTLDDTLAHDPIPGVGVRIFDETGASLLTTGTTDLAGKFQFDILGSDPAIRYQARFWKSGCSFSNPEYVDVYDPLPPLTANKFNVYGTVHTLAPARDPLYCKASGYFVYPNGRPVVDAMIRFENLFNPVMVGGLGVIGPIELRTDANGYAEVDLARNGEYQAIVSGMQDEYLRILVPDRDSVSLIDLLWPVVAQVTFSPAAPWSVPVGGTLDVVPTILTSSYVQLDPIAFEDVSYSTADPGVALVQYGDGKITLIGVAAGTTTLVLARVDDSIHRTPDPTIIGSGGVISVS